jgi:hypothetical protein
LSKVILGFVTMLSTMMVVYAVSWERLDRKLGRIIKGIEK